MNMITKLMNWMFHQNTTSHQELLKNNCEKHERDKLQRQHFSRHAATKQSAMAREDSPSKRNDRQNSRRKAEREDIRSFSGSMRPLDANNSALAGAIDGNSDASDTNSGEWGQRFCEVMLTTPWSRMEAAGRKFDEIIINAAKSGRGLTQQDMQALKQIDWSDCHRLNERLQALNQNDKGSCNNGPR